MSSVGVMEDGRGTENESAFVCQSLSLARVVQAVNECHTKQELTAVVDEIDQLFFTLDLEVMDDFWVQLTALVGQRCEAIDQAQA